MREKTLGILGGVGPLATVYFADLIVKMTPAACDQDHIRTIVSNNPKIPDRTDYILDRTKPNPLPAMIADARMLESLGCDEIAIPCNTAHFFFDEIQKNVGVRIVNIIEETLKFAHRSVPGLSKVGVLATTGTLQSDVYPHVARQFGIECVYPDADSVRTLMHIIYDQVKAGKRADQDAFFAIVDGMKADGCDAVILGCTELSVIYYELQIKRPDVLDSMTALAAACVQDIKGSVLL
ncbi:MAG: aspartate/glutamate racemase family protein [Clostridia bacterium]|nr:aspartate/glutamate racemase family protein [Clostridia bacterium]